MAVRIKDKPEAIDPITLSVVWNRLLTLTYECGERVHLGAQSWLMGAARDLGCVLLTADVEIAAQVEFLAAHTIGSEIPARIILSHFPRLDPGDMALANDSHIIHAGHLPDWTTMTPIYYKDEIVFYAYIRGHQMDSGGAYSGSYYPRAYDCISEGLNIPPLKLIKKGKINKDVAKLIFDNVRQPEAIRSDLLIMYGSAIKMQEDVNELIDKYGLETVKACTREMMRRDEAATRSQIKKWPDGVYYGECACDWDGTVPDKQVWVRVKLTKKEDTLTFDFSDSDDQVDFINSPLGTTYCYTYGALFLTLDPVIPHNHGSMRAVTIIAPEGKCVNPTRPHTYGACGCMLGCEIAQACLKALAQAAPEQVMGCPGWQFESDITGRVPLIDPRTGRQLEYFANPFIAQGGSGALKGYDGWDGVCGLVVMGSIRRGSVEESELILPIRYDLLKINPDSEGPGEFVGAKGTYSERRCVIDPRGKMQIQAGNCSGATYPPYGAAGAPPAPLGEIYMLRARKKDKEIFKTVDYGDTFPGDVFMVTAMGSGGWGDPFKRDPVKVRVAIRDRFMTVQRARSVYGVVTTQKDPRNPETIEVDYPATEKLRKKLRGQPVYRDIDQVRDEVRKGALSLQEAKGVYGVAFQPNAPGDLKNILVDYIATQDLRNRMMAELAK